MSAPETDPAIIAGFEQLNRRLDHVDQRLDALQTAVQTLQGDVKTLQSDFTWIKRAFTVISVLSVGVTVTVFVFVLNRAFSVPQPTSQIAVIEPLSPAVSP